MPMPPPVRKLALTAHVTSSVSWLGAVLAFLVLAIAGLVNENAELVRAAYLAMEFITWFVIVPLSIASLLTGLIQSLGTPWGLFRHYWVVAKLFVTVIASIILLLHTQPISRIASIAAEGPLASGDLHRLRIQLIADAVAAIVALTAATALSIYKPWGLTVYGRRLRSHSAAEEVPSFPWGKVVLTIAGLALGAVVILHLTGIISGRH